MLELKNIHQINGPMCQFFHDQFDYVQNLENDYVHICRLMIIINISF